MMMLEQTMIMMIANYDVDEDDDNLNSEMRSNQRVGQIDVEPGTE